MTTTAADIRHAGYAWGMAKAAAGDNQPGPHPGQPQPPDTHRVRNVALGAAVLAGGLLSAKPVTQFLKGQNNIATTMAKKNLAQGMSYRSAAPAKAGFVDKLVDRIGGRKPSTTGKGVFAAGGDALRPSIKDKAGALFEHHAPGIKAKYEGYKRDLMNQRFMQALKTQAPPASGPSLKSRLKWGLLPAAAIGGGAVAGASAASRAHQPQDSAPT